MAIRIVTDSTADLPAELAAANEIEVVPLNVHFGEEVLKDGVEIWAEDFYHRLRNSPIQPNTSQPSPGDFLTAYQKVGQPGDTIISIHISQALSGTIGSADLAARMLERDCQVLTFDSQSASMGLGLMALQAARLARAGSDPAEVMERLASWRQQAKIFFTVNSLEYLQRTGRIGKAAAFLGCLLSIKPLLSVVDGVVTPVEKIRGNFTKVAQEMTAQLQQQFGDTPLLVAFIHTEMPKEIQILKEIAAQSLQIKESFSSLVGPVVGSHSGPETIGIVALPAS